MAAPALAPVWSLCMGLHPPHVAFVQSIITAALFPVQPYQDSADVTCDGVVDVVDVMTSIRGTLGLDLGALDSDSNGCIDLCEPAEMTLSDMGFRGRRWNPKTWWSNVYYPSDAVIWGIDEESMPFNPPDVIWRTFIFAEVDLPSVFDGSYDFEALGTMQAIKDVTFALVEPWIEISGVNDTFWEFSVTEGSYSKFEVGLGTLGLPTALYDMRICASLAVSDDVSCTNWKEVWLAESVEDACEIFPGGVLPDELLEACL